MSEKHCRPLPRPAGPSPPRGRGHRPLPAVQHPPTWQPSTLRAVRHREAQRQRHGRHGRPLPQPAGPSPPRRRGRRPLPAVKRRGAQRRRQGRHGRHQPPRPAWSGRPLPRPAGPSPPRRRGSRRPSLRSSTARPSDGGTDGTTSPSPGLQGHPLPADVAVAPSQRSSTARCSVGGTDGTTGPSPGLQGHPLPIDVAAAPSLRSSTTRPSVGGTDGMDGPTPLRPTGPSPPRPVWPPPAPSGPAPRARCHPNETTTNDAASRRKNATPSEPQR